MKARLVTLASFFLINACNPNDYFAQNMAIGGSDAFCSQATTQVACDALPACQSAFEDLESDVETPIFAACISNPPADPTTDPGTNPGTDPGTDPGTNPGTDPGINPGTDPGTNPGTSTGDEPTIDDVAIMGCDNLDAKYLYVTTITEKKNKKTSVTKNVKVKVCHQTGNMAAHTVIIACPAVKSHVHHHDDYLGACHAAQ